jgi:hypothetical protein
MAVFLGLIILNIAVALLLVWFIVTHDVSRLRAVILILVALIIVSGFSVATGYFGLRIHINDHYEINLVMLRLFVLPPITAGVIEGLVSAAMFAALRRRERPSNV